MDELQKLLRIVEALDASTRTKDEPAPSDTELSEAREALITELRNAAEGTSPDIAAARAIRSAIDKIDAEQVTRSEAVAAAKAEATELLKGIAGQEETDEEAAAAEAAAAEAAEAAESEEKPSAVAASLLDAINRSTRRQNNRAAEQARSAKSNPDVIVAATGPAQGYPLPESATIDDVAELFTRYAPQIKRGGAVLLHLEKMYPESRSLGLSSTENTQVIEALASPRAITAAGGICEPLPADFAHPICGDRGRPIRDSLPAFRADRGGIRFSPAVSLALLDSAITVWTADTDAAPGSTVKGCPRIVCDEEQTSSVDAIVGCLTVGNFQARFNPEFWKSRLDLLMVTHDRVAEQTAYSTMADGSTAVTYGGGEGTVVDVLQALDKASAGLRSRHRLSKKTTLRAVMPAWLQDALRAHLAGQTPSGSTDLFEVADQMLNAFFSVRNIRPVWSLDIEVFGTQNTGGLLTFPGGDVEVLLYPEGTWMFLDGGTLDLGTSITDSTLNSVNDRQAFIETFEQVTMRGCESLIIDIPVAEICICTGTDVS